jgi:large subunit ribosomal protein L21
MYAVIKTGGKQYKVEAGATLKVEKLLGEVGSKVVIDKVLMINDGENTTIGAPLIAGATVNATVVSHGRADKVMIFKFRRRKHYRKTQGHRQSFTEILINDVNGKGAAAKPATVAKTAEPKAAKAPAAVKPAAKVAKPAAAKKAKAV